MSQRASRDWKEVWDRSIPQNGAGGKRPSASEVGSPMEGQAHRRSGAARIFGIGKSGGLTPPSALAGVFRLNQALPKTGFPNLFGSVKYFLSEL